MPLAIDMNRTDASVRTAIRFPTPYEFDTPNQNHSALLQRAFSWEFIFGAFVPLSIVIIAIIYDIIAAAHIPKGIRTRVSYLASPFRQFLTLEDFDDVDVTLPPPVWKNRILSLLALVNAVGWLAYFAYACAVNDSIAAPQASIASLTWV